MATSMADISAAVQKRALAAREGYAAKGRTGKANVLVYGDYGTGKSTFIGTAPKPIWVHLFDSGGMTTASLQPMIESGDIIIEDFTSDSWKQPEKFRAWERALTEMRRDKVFEAIGTFAIDSITKWADSLMYEIIRMFGGGKNDFIPQQRDYLLQQLTAVDYLEKLCDIPCNLIVTGHIGLDKDEVTGKMETGLFLSGKLTTKVPLVFDEKWLTKVEGRGTELRHIVQTHNDGYYKAETRMGGEAFLQYEEPDFKALLLKAGRTVAAQDKPSLFPKE